MPQQRNDLVEKHDQAAPHQTKITVELIPKAHGAVGTTPQHAHAQPHQQQQQQQQQPSTRAQPSSIRSNRKDPDTPAFRHFQ
ncbi:hypothetical protein LLE67_18670 [Xanthomonas campestris]|uniref:hypothetical protein n=1 Tax=Xanthomonas campestris TaxID=339 RepID=UPI001E65AE72|nr:hypothetical protein [Xanthomonas campestris]MCC5069833.1 hypothetical protein [Xanthomonas campestris]